MWLIKENRWKEEACEQKRSDCAQISKCNKMTIIYQRCTLSYNM